MQLDHQLPVTEADVKGRSLLSTPIVAAPKQSGLDFLIVDPVAGSSGFHELIVECKFTAGDGSTTFKVDELKKKVTLMQNHAQGRGTMLAVVVCMFGTSAVMCLVFVIGIPTLLKAQEEAISRAFVVMACRKVAAAVTTYLTDGTKSVANEEI